MKKCKTCGKECKYELCNSCRAKERREKHKHDKCKHCGREGVYSKGLCYKHWKQLKEFGFKKHGRTLHRFVSEDISQVINFQCGQPYRNETHLMWVNIGIRVPESFERKFEAVNSKKYYHEYECNIRTRLGMEKLKDSNKATTYDLRKSIDHMTANIVEEILEDVLPVFEILNSRESIIAHRREYPWFDTLNSRLILLEESMIYGHMGDKKKAKECFEMYYRSVALKLSEGAHIKRHLEYLDELRSELEW